MPGKVTYRKIEGGAIVLVDGKPTGIFRLKGWMGNLLKTPERKFTSHTPSNKFYQTQYEYHGDRKH